jgi:hypothetical protein
MTNYVEAAVCAQGWGALLLVSYNPVLGQQAAGSVTLPSRAQLLVKIRWKIDKA